MTWDQETSFDYWIFYAAAAGITPLTYTQFPQARVMKSVTSPLLIGGLVNGTTYSFTMNKTQSGGPAGPASASIAITPQPAGISWKAGTPIAPVNFNAIALNSNSIGLAVGAGGKIYSTTDFTGWTAQTSNTTNDLRAIANGTTPADLTALAAGTLASTLVVAGTNGTILASGDGVTWSASGSGVSTSLNGVAYGASLYVVVGDAGVILTSPDAATWTAQASGTSNNLYGLAYLNGNFVAIGANGTILTSIDAVTWTAQTSGTSADLYAATYGLASYIVVGARGTILSSTDALSWTVQTPISQNLYSVAAGTQVVAVGAGGTIVYGTPTTSWAVAASGTSSDLRSVIAAYGTGYLAIGAAGANTVSR